MKYQPVVMEELWDVLFLDVFFEEYSISWVVPLPSNSDHQDYEPFLVGNPYKPSFPL